MLIMMIMMMIRVRRCQALAMRLVITFDYGHNDDYDYNQNLVESLHTHNLQLRQICALHISDENDKLFDLSKFSKFVIAIKYELNLIQSKRGPGNFFLVGKNVKNIDMFNNCTTYTMEKLLSRSVKRNFASHFHFLIT